MYQRLSLRTQLPNNCITAVVVNFGLFCAIETPLHERRSVALAWRRAPYRTELSGSDSAPTARGLTAPRGLSLAPSQSNSTSALRVCASSTADGSTKTYRSFTRRQICIALPSYHQGLPRLASRPLTLCASNRDPLAYAFLCHVPQNHEYPG